MSAGRGGVRPPLPTFGVIEVQMQGVGGNTISGIKGRKWGPWISTVYSLLIYEITSN